MWHERLGKTVDEISAAHDLSGAEVYAALAYYFDHRQAIDQSIAADESFAAALKQQTPSILQIR